MGYSVRIRVISQDVSADIACEIISKILGKQLEKCEESIVNSSYVEVYIEEEEELRSIESALKRYGFISYEVEKTEVVKLSKLRIKRLTQGVSEDVLCELLKEILGEGIDQIECRKRFRLHNYLDVEVAQEQKKAILDALRKLGYVYVEDLSKQGSIENSEKGQYNQVYTEQTVENQKEHKKANGLPFKIFIDIGTIAGNVQPFIYLYYIGQAVLFFGFLTTFVKVGTLSISLLWLMFNAGLYFNLMFASVILLSLISSYLTFTKRFATALVLTFMQLSDATLLFIYTKLNLESIRIYLTFVKLLTSEAEARKIESIIPELGPAIKLIVAGSILSLIALFYVYSRGYSLENTLKEFRELANKLGFGNMTQAVITSGLILLFSSITLSIYRELESRKKKPFEEDLKSHIGLLYNSVGISSYKENYLDTRAILFELLKGMDEGRMTPEIIKNQIENYKLSQFYRDINEKCAKSDLEFEELYTSIKNKRNINCDYKKIQDKFLDVLNSLYYIADAYREIRIFERRYKADMDYLIGELRDSYSYEELYLKMNMLRIYKKWTMKHVEW